MKRGSKSSLTRKAMQAMRDAVAKVLEEHQRTSRPLALWRNGKAVWVPATDIGALRESPTPTEPTIEPESLI